MPFEVKLPDVGEGVAEGEIVRWMVKAGDSVREDQPLVEVMTDKASVEIPSPRAGVIAALHAEEGQVVPVGTVIVTIEVAGGPATAGAGPAAHHATGSAGAASAFTTTTAPAATGAIQATPAVRQLAKQLGVTLEGLRGTGTGGRITQEDVQNAVGKSAATAAAGPSRPPSAPDATGVPAPEPTPAAKTAGAGAAVAAATEERIPLRGLRRKIAEHMRHSIATAAHFTFVAECDMTAVVEHRERMLPRAREKGVSLTYLAYVVKAMVEPLRKFPLLNASLDDARSEIVVKRDIHVGIATATEEGLTVPVVRDAGRRTLLDLASEIQRLAAAARAGKLKLDELQGGTITVTSTGARGGLLATPILHHPQVAIVGVHEVKKKPAVVDDRIVARDMTNLSLSLDHRVVDGAVGADFLYEVIARLQQPESWLDAKATG